MTDRMNAGLRVGLTDEIRKAVFSMSDVKSPGPDGMNACFFKKSWTITGELVCAAVKEFHCSGKILTQINNTSVSLLLKCVNASSISDFRPIYCCNVVYKILTKVLANRLKHMLPDLIDPCQNAFVSGRDLFQNIFVTQELVRLYGRSKVSPRCFLNIDLKKAYDSIN